MIEMPIGDIQELRLVIGKRCRVESLNDGKTRTLTITTEKGVVCTFKGEMEFTWSERT